MKCKERGKEREGGGVEKREEEKGQGKRGGDDSNMLTP